MALALLLSLLAFGTPVTLGSVEAKKTAPTILEGMSLRETLSSLRCCSRALGRALGHALVEAVLPITLGSPMKGVAQSPAVWWLTCHDRVAVSLATGLVSTDRYMPPPSAA